MKNQTPHTLRRQLRVQMKRLHKHYAAALSNDSSQRGATEKQRTAEQGEQHARIREWLGDNYYVLAREGAGVLKSLKSAAELPSGERGLPELFHDCVAACAGGVLPETGELAKALCRRELSAAEAQSTELMLRAALLHIAGEAVEKGNAQMLGCAIGSIRNLQEMDFEALVEQVSGLEQLLMQDPAGVYAQMDETTRALYRRQVGRKARQCRMEEQVVAALALEKARKKNEHIGFFLWHDRHRRKRGKTFLVLEIVLPALVSLLLALLTKAWYLPFMVFLPLWEALRSVLERLSLRGVPPDYLPRLKEDSDLARQSKTLITVSMLLPGAGEAAAIQKRLLDLWRSNGQANIRICCLLDLKGASSPEQPEDHAAITAVRSCVADLNRRYGDAFALAIRPRIFSPTMGNYTGKERKRGAINELVRAIQGDESGFLVLDGDKSFLHETMFLLALDADTLLPMDTAAELVAVGAHPLNRPVTDKKRGLVRKGYGVIVPRIVNELFSRNVTAFTKYMAGDGGITLYDSFASERYQDLFGEGIFAGKGLLDVQTFSDLLNHAFPEEQVLSHDILEGGFLRAGYASDLQAADGFPRRQSSYFARLSRWVRGDWQNLGFLWGKQPLSALTRFKLLDNLRRSLTPVFACLCLLAALCLPTLPAAVLTICAVLAVAGPSLLAFLRCLASGGPHVLSRLHYSGVLPAALSLLMRSLLALVLLPQTAYVCLDAMIRALWRSFVSHKKLLEWTTAAQSEQNGSGFSWKAVAQLWPTALAAALLLLFGVSYQRFLALFFLADIPFALLSGREKRTERRKPDYFAREKLQSYAAAMWKYYEEFCNAENHYLPPDNVQETPVYTVAQRTSPTNIGLALLCCLAARDLGLIATPELCRRLGESLNSIEKLEKWNGNLLNWYDTRTLAPLEPRYVSTVDSGNFLCTLVALRQGLREYLGEDAQLQTLISRVDALLTACDITPLYHRRRKLFHIGIDLSTGELSPSFYDLLMSEARMTGYYAIASRAVGKKHWGAMGRMLAREGRYTGPVSWTGTMFEYFMPNLFLPAPKGSLSYEGLEFCLWCQRRRVRDNSVPKGKVLPWGISESGFYAFDRQLNYQYKAHGTQKLGLKRGLNQELVIAPYATFLALPLAPEAALRNLKLLEKMEMSGRCGFYEAADFTPSRTGGQDYAVVRSYMAHHVGMSLLSVLNALRENILQKRFLSDDSMASASSLLLEKIPSGTAVFEDVQEREIPQTRERLETPVREYDHISAAQPHVKLLTNGEWTSVLSDTGAGVSLYRGSNVTRHSRDLLRRPNGIFAAFYYGDKVLPAVSALGEGDALRFHAQFCDNEVQHSARNAVLRIRTKTQVHPRLPCEQRQYQVKNYTGAELRGELRIYLEPSVIQGAVEQEHPAFSKLFLLDEYDEKNRLLLFTRRPRGKGQPLCLAVGFAEDIPFGWETAREKVLDGMHSTISFLQKKAVFQGGRGNPDVCAAFSVPLRLPPKGSRKLSLLLACASTRSEARERLLKAREQGGVVTGKGALCPFAGGGLESVIAENVLPSLFFACRQGQESRDAIRENTLRGRDTLWSLGISGDYPIVYVAVDSPENAVFALPYLRLSRRLYACGVITDVVIAYHEGGEYDTPITTALRELLKRENCEPGDGAPGGVHMVNFDQRSKQEETALKAAACFIAPQTAQSQQQEEAVFCPAQLHSVQAQKFTNTPELSVRGGFFADDAFYVDAAQPPARPWSFLLCNASFGTMVSSRALGYTWAINARENKLTPWFNDPCSDNRGELLLAKIDGKIYDLLQGASARFSPDEAVWEGEAAGIPFTVRVYVPSKGMVKFCEVTLRQETNAKRNMIIAYYLEPVMGASHAGIGCITGSRRGEGAVFSSTASTIAGYGALCVQGGADAVSFARADFLSGNWGDFGSLPQGDPCVAVMKQVQLAQKEETALRFTLAYAANVQAALRMPRLAKWAEPEKDRLRLCIETPDAAINQMVNTFLPAQILSARLQGRTGFYQCGGAWGFRDQLQDVSAFLLTRPRLVRQHILRCCAVQFTQGDVLHWWHRLPKSAGGLRGVRTKCSDDLLWLPLVTADYVQATGDVSFLEIQAPFLTGEPLRQDEHERYFQPRRGELRGTVYEHCIRALECAAKFGDHNLPLIGVGDWNDGFSSVGEKGKGESVWLAQFYSLVLEKMLPVCEKMGDIEHLEVFRRTTLLLKTTVDDVAWEGEHYLRAFYDDGSPMGKRGNSECAIDSLPQSFSVLAGMPSAQRRKSALDAALSTLVDEEHGVVKLFTPPFSGHGARPGYVASYPQGIRENGGQYTHAAVWLAMALLREGRVEEGWRLLCMLNPAHVCQDARNAERYAAEPYALAGDVSAGEGLEGRAGWSLYTGSAAWLYRVVTQELLGLRMQNGKLTFQPRLPESWKDCYVQLQGEKGKIMAELRNEKSTITVDSQSAAWVDTGRKEHRVEYR